MPLMIQDPVYDSLFQSRGNPVAKKAPPTSSAAKKASPSTNIGNDFSFIFGGDLIIMCDFHCDLAYLRANLLLMLII